MQDRTDDASIRAELGRQLKAARTARKLSMRTLAAASDISQPFLSQIESGRTMPSITTLFGLARGLGVSPSALLPGPERPESITVLRRDEPAAVPVAEGDESAVSRILSSERTQGAAVQEYRLRGPYAGDWFVSDGQNTVYVVDGAVTVEIDGRGAWELGPGDALTHPGALRNRWRVPGEIPATLLLIHSPAL